MLLLGTKGNIKPMVITKTKEVPHITPRLGQDRAGLRHKIKTQISKPLTQINGNKTVKGLIA